MNAKPILIGCLTIAITAWLGITFYRAYQPHTQYFQGQVMAREYAVSSKLAGRIEEIYVKKGDQVKKGDKIFSMEILELEAKLAQAKAGYEAAKALNKEAQKGSREETIEAAKNVWEAAKVMNELSQKSYERVEQLYNEGVVSLQRRDEAYAASASTQYNANSAYQQYKIALEGAREETKEVTFQQEMAAFEQLNEVEVYLRDKDAIAPMSGEVSNILIHAGELSPSGFPVVKLVDMQDSWLRISVPESSLKRFSVGSEFEGYIPALDKIVRFKVYYLSVLGDFATWKATAHSSNYDMKTYEINAHFMEAVEGLRVGMSVLVEDI